MSDQSGVASGKASGKLETEVCSRCGGSGHYSRCQMFGTTCFKCVGKRVVLTKRGAAAAGYLKGLRSRTTASLKVGDVINTSFGWATVTALVPAVQEGTSLKGGVMVPYRMEGIDVVTDKVTLCCALPDAMHEARLSQEERRATFASALAFQETLTKAGTPRKSR